MELLLMYVCRSRTPLKSVSLTASLPPRTLPLLHVQEAVAAGAAAGGQLSGAAGGWQLTRAGRTDIRSQCSYTHLRLSCCTLCSWNCFSRALKAEDGRCSDSSWDASSAM